MWALACGQQGDSSQQMSNSSWNESWWFTELLAAVLIILIINISTPTSETLREIMTEGDPGTKAWRFLVLQQMWPISGWWGTYGYISLWWGNSASPLIKGTVSHIFKRLNNLNTVLGLLLFSNKYLSLLSDLYFTLFTVTPLVFKVYISKCIYCFQTFILS